MADFTFALSEEGLRRALRLAIREALPRRDLPIAASTLAGIPYVGTLDIERIGVGTVRLEPPMRVITPGLVVFFVLRYMLSSASLLERAGLAEYPRACTELGGPALQLCLPVDKRSMLDVPVGIILRGEAVFDGAWTIDVQPRREGARLTGWLLRVALDPPTELTIGGFDAGRLVKAYRSALKAAAALDAGLQGLTATLGSFLGNAIPIETLLALTHAALLGAMPPIEVHAVDFSSRLEHPIDMPPVQGMLVIELADLQAHVSVPEAHPPELVVTASITAPM